MKRQRVFTATALVLASSLALSACGGDDGGGGGGGSGADGSGDTRTVETAMGPVEVPEEPQRVVVLDTPELDSLLTLGITPVGAVRADVASGFLEYLPADELTDVENIGNIAAPNLERINELDPDLILGSKLRDEERYDELSAIAPTVFTENPGSEWKANFLVHADALNKNAEGEAVVGEYERQAAEATEAIGGPEEAASTNVTVLRFIEGGDTRLYGEDNYIGSVLADVGLGRPEIVTEAEDGFAVEISPEQIDLAEADVIFYASYGSPEKSGQEQAVGGPLWTSMTAVREDMVFPVDDQLWFLGIGYTAAEQVLAELTEHLAP